MSEPGDLSSGPSCPVPAPASDAIQLAHGGGGRLSRTLIESLFLDAFRNPALAAMHDGALLDAGDTRLAFSTDSFVVRPLFFPGGDIGSLAVHGTVNDLAMCGARPVALSAGFILEEGFPQDDLRRIVESMRRAAEDVGVPIVTGDTKVVDHGKGDGVYVNTAGIGIPLPGADVAPDRARPGDAVLLSGPIGLHGVAILSVREGLAFETTIASDSAPLHGLVRRIVECAAGDLHVLRDPTRGGLAAALDEIASSAGVGVRIDEREIPVPEEVRGACEILGLDPLYVANEGKCVAIVAPDRAPDVLETMRAHEHGRGATRIGEIVDRHPGRVVLRSTIGGERVVDLPTGEQLPRIC